MNWQNIKIGAKTKETMLANNSNNNKNKNNKIYTVNKPDPDITNAHDQIKRAKPSHDKVFRRKPIISGQTSHEVDVSSVQG